MACNAQRTCGLVGGLKLLRYVQQGASGVISGPLKTHVTHMCDQPTFQTCLQLFSQLSSL